MEMQLLTKDEKARLEQQLKDMIARRPVIAKAIAEAREKGDLKENADYHAARDEMAMLEANIKRMEERLKAVTVVGDNEVPEDMVFLGSTVLVKNTKTGDEEKFRIVGELGNASLDSDSEIMDVTAKSPLGESLMRARIGQTVRVSVPRGELYYEIVKIL